MEFAEKYQSMLDRFNRKRELHHRAHTLYKNRDMKVFTIPLMVVQLLNAILPQLSEALPDYSKILGIISSTLAAISAIWLGFQAKKRYAERSESHKNAASIFQHLAVLSMNERQKAEMTKDNDEKKFLAFQDMVQNLEGKAKDDENLVPIRIVKALKLEKEREEEKKNRKEELNKTNTEHKIQVDEHLANGGLTLPALTHENGKSVSSSTNGPQVTQYI